MVCLFYSLEEAGCENSYVFWDWNNYMWYVKIKEHTFDFLAIDGRWCIALTKAEKIRKIQEVLELKNLYADLLKTMGEEY